MSDHRNYMNALATMDNLFMDKRDLSENEWHEVGIRLEKLCSAAMQRRQPTRPQPRISGSGVAICSTSCTMFSAYDGAKLLAAGRCLSGSGHPTRAGVPCFPWVEHFVNEHNNKPEVLP
jgi:hypothetical protein